MSLTRWIPRVGLVALPLLLLAQCTTDGTQPVAPLSITAGGTEPCPAGPNVVRDFTLVYPPPGPICSGLCTSIRWQFANPCGDFFASVEAWYDDVYYPLGEFKNVNSIHWDSPLGPHAVAAAKNSVRLRIKALDNLGIINVQDVTLSPIIPAPAPPRVPLERD